MPQIMNYVWVAFIIITIINALIWRRRSQPYIARNPNLASTYKKLILWFALAGNIPWVVMGLAFLAGGVRSMEDFFRTREANPWVIAWFACVWVIVVLLLWWVFYRDGAKALCDCPGWARFTITNPDYVKLIALGVFIASLIGTAVAFAAGKPVTYFTNSANEYETVFVVGDSFWRILAIAFAVIGIGVVMLTISITWIRRLKCPRWWNEKKAWKPGFLLVWSVLWLSLSLIGFSFNLRNNWILLSAYRNGRAQVVEGYVDVIHQQPPGGHAEGDVVTINGVRLVIDHFVVTVAYKQTIAYGGALSEGTYARVWYHGSDVLRVDVKR